MNEKGYYKRRSSEIRPVHPQGNIDLQRRAFRLSREEAAKFSPLFADSREPTSEEAEILRYVETKVDAVIAAGCQRRPARINNRY